MRVEVDQSGRVERLNTATVVAASNGTAQAVIMLAGAKQRLIRKLRKTLIPSRDVPVLIFAVLVFTLLQRLSPSPTVVIIDEEYTGKEDIIEETLTKLLKRSGKRLPVIRFSRIGRHSNAHQAAWKVHRQKGRSRGFKIAETDILKLWEIKSRP